ncbi:MAG: hypothetical protein WAS54_05765 [Scrofimicrobium sp.]
MTNQTQAKATDLVEALAVRLPTGFALVSLGVPSIADTTESFLKAEALFLITDQLITDQLSS